MYYKGSSRLIFFAVCSVSENKASRKKQFRKKNGSTKEMVLKNWLIGYPNVSVRHRFLPKENTDASSCGMNEYMRDRIHVFVSSPLIYIQETRMMFVLYIHARLFILYDTSNRNNPIGTVFSFQHPQFKFSDRLG
jgi:hypothetical protein